MPRSATIDRLSAHVRGLAAAPASDARQSLLDLIRTIDMAFCADPSPEVVRGVRLLLAECVVALGPRMPRPSPRVDATVAAARQLLADPSEASERAFLAAATASYPFGPGDGALGVAALGDDAVGGGHRSGSGFLWAVAQEIGPEPTLRALTGPLADWTGGRKRTA